LELELRQFGSQQLDLRQIAALDASLIDTNDVAKRSQVLLGQGKVFLRQQDFDERVLHIQDERTGGIQQLQRDDGAAVLGDGDPALALTTPFEHEVRT